MLVNDLLDLVTDDALVTIHDANGAEVTAYTRKDDLPEFMLEYTVQDASLGANALSVYGKHECHTLGVAEFTLKYSIESIFGDDGDHNAKSISIVLADETYLQAFSIMRELVNELDDLGDCRSLEQATEETLERLRDISHTARRLRDNIRRGRSWRYDLFPTCERLRERRG